VASEERTRALQAAAERRVEHLAFRLTMASARGMADTMLHELVETLWETESLAAWASNIYAGLADVKGLSARMYASILSCAESDAQYALAEPEDPSFRSTALAYLAAMEASGYMPDAVEAAAIAELRTAARTQDGDAR
jgi:hypothetical protein